MSNLDDDDDDDGSSEDLWRIYLGMANEKVKTSLCLAKFMILLLDFVRFMG